MRLLTCDGWDDFGVGINSLIYVCACACLFLLSIFGSRLLTFEDRFVSGRSNMVILIAVAFVTARMCPVQCKRLGHYCQVLMRPFSPGLADVLALFEER